MNRHLRRTLQLDIVNNASEMLKIAACMDDNNFDEVSKVILALDDLTDYLAKTSEPEQKSRRKCPDYINA